jgi:legumain
VNPKNFLAILKGEDTKVKGGTGRVLKSSKSSKVFINFSDHGSPGLIQFPNDDYLYAHDLMQTIKFMHQNELYQEMVLYIEACESGSMFDWFLPNDIKVLAVTAANPYESSWGMYCQPDDFVQGKEINSCLGDLFSVNWMDLTEREDISKVTLDQQFALVKNLTTRSHVMRYGDLSFLAEPIGNFLGNLNLEKTEEYPEVIASHFPLK